MSIMVRSEVATKIWTHNPPTPLETEGGHNVPPPRTLETAEGPALNRVKRWHCCQALFYDNIKSAWQSAEENYTLLPGQVQKCGSITLNFDKKCPGWTLLNSALEPTQVFHLQTMGEMTKLSTVAVYQLYDTMHMLCHIFGQMSRFTRIVSHFSWNVAIYALCRILLKCRDLRVLPGTNFLLTGI